MIGGTPIANSAWLIAWAAGVIIFGLALASIVIRVGRLRRSERERLDRNTRAVQHVEEVAEANAARPDFGFRRNVPYGIVIPVVVVCLAIFLMIWAFYGTTGQNQQTSAPHQQGTTTTGSAPARPNNPAAANQPVQAPVAPGNDAESDSARGAQEPLNKPR
jgi:hypothetical protein